MVSAFYSVVDICLEGTQALWCSGVNGGWGGCCESNHKPTHREPKKLFRLQIRPYMTSLHARMLVCAHPRASKINDSLGAVSNALCPQSLSSQYPRHFFCPKSLIIQALSRSPLIRSRLLHALSRQLTIVYIAGILKELFDVMPTGKRTCARQKHAF